MSTNEFRQVAFFTNIFFYRFFNNANNNFIISVLNKLTVNVLTLGIESLSFLNLDE